VRALLLALTAGASGLLAAGGFAAAAWLDVFSPCRVSYRVSDQVYGSLACQLYYMIAQLSTVLAFAACGLAAVAGILFLVRRRIED
jgi:hypothetical protein